MTLYQKFWFTLLFIASKRLFGVVAVGEKDDGSVLAIHMAPTEEDMAASIKELYEDSKKG